MQLNVSNGFRMTKGGVLGRTATVDQTDLERDITLLDQFHVLGSPTVGRRKQH